MLDLRIENSARWLLPGDLLVLGGVFAAGTVHHSSIELLFSDPVYVILTVVPFLLGWLIAGPLLGAYGPRAVASAHDSAVVAVQAWVFGAVVASMIRATPLFSGGASVTFFLVALGSGAAGLAIWRAVAIRLR